jgi:hypothetical protein
MVKLGDLESDRTGKLIAEAILLRIYFLSLSCIDAWLQPLNFSICLSNGLGWATIAQINNIETHWASVVLTQESFFSHAPPDFQFPLAMQYASV